MNGLFEFHRQVFSFPGAAVLVALLAGAVVVSVAGSSSRAASIRMLVILAAAISWFVYAVYEVAFRFFSESAESISSYELFVVPGLYFALLLGAAAYAVGFRGWSRA